VVISATHETSREPIAPLGDLVNCGQADPNRQTGSVIQKNPPPKR
jgi:hypothetical protein